MPFNIAVALDQHGNTTSIDEPARIVVYQKKQDAWLAVQEFVYDLEQSKGVRHMRQKLAELVADIAKSSQIFVGLSVTGIPYFELEKAGMVIWEFEGRPAEFLSYIEDKEEEARLARDKMKPIAVPAPRQTAPGRFFISLKEVQENNAGITSKQVLFSFVNKAEFDQLEVVCNHVPPWLETIVLEKNFVCLKEQISQKEIRVTVSKK
ncbi:nitrogenase|uniref:Fe-only nitrogenase accessory protein AnfO n=1 Tax=Dendrosporobacter quercicolus TaxID=146817 RepID=A0A1G9U9V1_9FIRM|nr:Fe-only nitrogenase accessory AnfO family protein [Dendrosporobacter quercicolus]NSL49943.1 nitrogenase [Dendrosporobacter quercicolus DSM 1736]SDM56720.1 Fe-only nitrogenase accessory protein AnfO [Dendrosporobacter quercicolus]